MTMPIFEYRCKECGHVSSFLEKPDSRGKHPCEECGSTQTEKVFSTFSAKAGESSSGDAGSCPTGTCPL
jgi:putative FmdB family regulatory protein